MLCVGCATDGTEGVPQYDSRSGMSYYEWLYRDSAFLECPGNPDKPWEDPVSPTQLARVYQRMARHARLTDTLTWDFTMEEMKVTPRIYEDIISNWVYLNRLLRTGMYEVLLDDLNFRVFPKDDVDDSKPLPHEQIEYSIHR